VSRYHFVRTEKANHTVVMLCRVMKVSRSGYYDWIARSPSKRELENDKLDNCILKTYKEGKGRYGYRRIYYALKNAGIKTSLRRVQRRMDLLNLKAKRRKAYKQTTKSEKGNPVPPNQLDRQFSPSEKNRSWVTDVTYIGTKEGWLFLSLIIDLWSRKIIGWSMSKNNDTDLIIASLKMALWLRNPSKGWIHHSDRGTPYMSTRYVKMLDRAHAKRSVSHRGDCYDNAVAESAFGSLKQEMVYMKNVFETREKAQIEILKYINWYNADRLHSTIGYVSPNNFEKGNVTKVVA
jgi:transposase InsO family protein